MNIDYTLVVSDELVDELQALCHGLSAHFWVDLKTGEDLKHAPHIVPEKLMLIVSEIAEAMEGHRKGLQDTHLPQFGMLEVELADAMIRILDLAGAMNLELGPALKAKLIYNQTRQDHTTEARLALGGKAY
jgi:NTP pyrophosphatase (non-canonical NTP hydrolase)